MATIGDGARVEVGDTVLITRGPRSGQTGIFVCRSSTHQCRVLLSNGQGMAAPRAHTLQLVSRGAFEKSAQKATPTDEQTSALAAEPSAATVDAPRAASAVDPASPSKSTAATAHFVMRSLTVASYEDSVPRRTPDQYAAGDQLLVVEGKRANTTVTYVSRYTKERIKARDANGRLAYPRYDQLRRPDAPSEPRFPLPALRAEGVRVVVAGHSDRAQLSVRRLEGDAVIVRQLVGDQEDELVVPRTLCRPLDMPATMFTRVKQDRPGSLYVMDPNDDQGLLKIGRTAGDPEDRCRHLQCGSPKISVAFSHQVASDHKVAEELTMLLGASHRLKTSGPGNEWYRMTLDRAVDVCERAQQLTDLAHYFKFGRRGPEQ